MQVLQLAVLWWQGADAENYGHRWAVNLLKPGFCEWWGGKWLKWWIIQLSLTRQGQANCFTIDLACYMGQAKDQWWSGRVQSSQGPQPTHFKWSNTPGSIEYKYRNKWGGEPIKLRSRVSNELKEKGWDASFMIRGWTNQTINRDIVQIGRTCLQSW